MVLLVSHMAVGEPGLQLVGWSIIAIFCLTMHLLVLPFDHRHMDMLNRIESQGLVVWLTSIMLLSVIVESHAPDWASALLLLLAMLLNLYHYFCLLSLICYHGLSQVAEKKDELSTRLTTIGTKFGVTAASWLSMPQSTVLTMPAVTWLSSLLAWHAQRDERRRMMFGKVWLDWDTGRLMWVEERRDTVPSSSPSSNEFHSNSKRRHGGRCCRIVGFVRSLWLGSSSERRLVRKGVLVSQMLSAAMEEAIELLKIKDVPPDFLDFLWSYCFVLHSSSAEKKLKKESIAPRHRPPEDGSREFSVVESLPSQVLSQMTEQARRVDMHSFWSRGLTASEESFIACGSVAADWARSGMTLHDLQSKLLLVVDELVTRQHDYEESIRRRARTKQHIRSLSVANLMTYHSSSGSLEAHDHVGGWRELYWTYQRAKQKMRHAEPPNLQIQMNGREDGAVVERPDAHLERIVTADVSNVSDEDEGVDARVQSFSVHS